MFFKKNGDDEKKSDKKSAPIVLKKKRRGIKPASLDRKERAVLKQDKTDSQDETIEDISSGLEDIISDLDSQTQAETDESSIDSLTDMLDSIDEMQDNKASAQDADESKTEGLSVSAEEIKKEENEDNLENTLSDLMDLTDSLDAVQEETHLGIEINDETPETKRTEAEKEEKMPEQSGIEQEVKSAESIMETESLDSLVDGIGKLESEDNDVTYIKDVDLDADAPTDIKIGDSEEIVLETEEDKTETMIEEPKAASRIIETEQIKEISLDDLKEGASITEEESAVAEKESMSDKIETEGLSDMLDAIDMTPEEEPAKETLVEETDNFGRKEEMVDFDSDTVKPAVENRILDTATIKADEESLNELVSIIMKKSVEEKELREKIADNGRQLNAVRRDIEREKGQLSRISEEYKKQKTKLELLEKESADKLYQVDSEYQKIKKEVEEKKNNKQTLNDGIETAIKEKKEFEELIREAKSKIDREGTNLNQIKLEKEKSENELNFLKKSIEEPEKIRALTLKAILRSTKSRRGRQGQ